MQECRFETALDEILARDQRYPRDAYIFIKDALDHTVQALGRGNEHHSRNVSCQELLDGIREHALKQFGPMAMIVFEDWNVRQCGDFGDLVFNMIAVDWLAKAEQDSRSDFDGGYDFWEAFRKPFLPPSRQADPLPEKATAA